MEQSDFALSPAQKRALFVDITSRSDKIFSIFMWGCLGFGLCLAPFYDTWFIATSVGSLLILAYYLPWILLPKSKLYQYVGSGCLALFTAQYIYQMHGLFEMHFFAFVGCTVLITYSNWRLQIPLFIIVVIHHAVFAYLQFMGMEGIYFTQLPYMDLTTFLFHCGLAGLIIFICGLWGYYSEKKVIEDGIRALLAEESLKRNLSLAEEIKNGIFDSEVVEDQNDALSLALLDMRTHIQASREKEKTENYINQGTNQIGKLFSKLGSTNSHELSQKILANTAKYIQANQASFFLKRSDETGIDHLKLFATYAHHGSLKAQEVIQMGEGILGQAALEQKPVQMDNLPTTYFDIGSSLGNAAPSQVLAWPLVVDQDLIGVMEFATFGDLSDLQRKFLAEVSPRIAGSLAIAEAQKRTEALLEASEELKADLQQSNIQLGAQAERLRDSEKNLKAQQNNLLEVNNQLENQKKALEKQNEEIELSKAALEQKTEELELANQYKSDFLANMSHELRTPLNSILILAEILASNKHERLSDKEIEHAQVIHRSGSDLLILINDILDLSKIESGKLDMIFESVSLAEITKDMEQLFRQVAIKKELHFSINVVEHVPAEIQTDRLRLEQILKNLLSNAFKFTGAQGQVSLDVQLAEKNHSFHTKSLQEGDSILCFSVSDTGIGIPEEKQAHIFEAFKQEDGSTSRKYGGTGLGLSICTQLATLFGGEIQLQSKKGKGSTFSLYIPLKDIDQKLGKSPIEPRKHNFPDAFRYAEEKNKTSNGEIPKKESEPQKKKYPEDRRKEIFKDKVLLLADDDMRNVFAISAILDGYEVEVNIANNGKDVQDALSMGIQPDAYIIDIMMPEVNGYETMKLIRSHGSFGQTPIIAITANDSSESKNKSFECGANVYLNKPLNKEELVDILCAYLEEKDTEKVKNT